MKVFLVHFRYQGAKGKWVRGERVEVAEDAISAAKSVHGKGPSKVITAVYERVMGESTVVSLTYDRTGETVSF